jgi:hypothetical protein
MKRNILMLLSLTTIVVVVCNNGIAGPFDTSLSSKVPDELIKWAWTRVDYSGNVSTQRSIKFFNVGNQGRFKRDFIMEDFYSVTEGTVKFEGDKYTIYPVKVEFLKGKGNEKSALRSQTYRWEIRKKDGTTYLYEFDEKDVNHNSPNVLKGIPLESD